MFKQSLVEINSNYLKLTEFNTLKEFEKYYLDEWRRNHQVIYYDIMDKEGVPINPFVEVDGVEIDLRKPSKRSEIVKGEHSEKSDEVDRLNWLRDCFKIYMLTDNITSLILAKDNLELQTTMFNSCISEIDMLHNELLEKKFIIDKYPFILTGLIKVREDILIKCSHLTYKATVVLSHQIKWLGGKNTLAALFYDLWKGQSRDVHGRSTDLEPLIDVKSARIIQEFLAANFTDKDGNHWEAKEFEDYLGKNDEKARGTTSKRIMLNYKK